MVLSERRLPEKATKCLIPNFIYMISRKRQNLETVKRPLIAREWVYREMNQWRTKDFRAVRFVCMILQWWIHVIIYLPKPTECTTHKVNPNMNSGLWVIIIY